MDVDALAKPMPILGSLSKCDAGKSKSSHFHVLAVYSIMLLSERSFAVFRAGDLRRLDK